MWVFTFLKYKDFFVADKKYFFKIEKSTWKGRGVPKMSMFVHKGGGGVKKTQKTVHMVCRWPLMENIQKYGNNNCISPS